MLNTVSDLAGEDFANVAAWLEDDGRPVDIRSVVMGRLVSGALVTLNACGSAIPSCHSDIRVFTTRAIVRTGIWGETLELQRTGAARLRKVRSIAPMPVWEQFLNVRAGRTVNPSPPEVGLRMARLWDAIRESDRDRRCRRHASLDRAASPTGSCRPGPRLGGRAMTRVIVWNEYRQEKSDSAGPRRLSGRHPRRDRRRDCAMPGSSSRVQPSMNRAWADRRASWRPPTS